MPDKDIGHLAILAVDHDSDATFTVCTQIKNIQPPEPSREDVDVTTLDDTVVKTLPSDPPDYGELSFDQVWHPGDTVHEHVETLFGARTICPWRITYPFSTAKTDTFSGWVKKISPMKLESKEAIKRTVTIRLTTEITRA